MFYRNKNIFKSKNKTALNIRQFLSYLNEDSSNSDWYGVSFQLHNNNKYIVSNDIYMYFNEAFSEVINFIGLNERWIIQPFQTKKLFHWFEYTDNMSEINMLKNIFPHPHDFKGYIIMDSTSIQLVFRGLFLYSYLTESQDLMLICEQKPVAIRLGQHLTLDIISSERKILDDIILLIKKYEYIVKYYK